MTRLEKLEALCKATPDNPFAWYSLAMEKKKSDPAAALEIFEKVRAEHPDYLPAYFHFAKTLEQADDFERAAEVYREGIALAQQKGDAHTLSELEAALDLL